MRRARLVRVGGKREIFATIAGAVFGFGLGATFRDEMKRSNRKASPSSTNDAIKAAPEGGLMTSTPLPLAVLPTSPRPSEKGLSLNSSSTLQDTVSTVLAGSVLSSSFPSREETTAHVISTCKYGLPSMDNIIVRKSYVASMNFKTRTPNWVAERIVASNMSETTNVEGVALRHNSQFKSDHSIPESVRANVKDYWKSGYSRGHLAAAASHKHSQSDMDDTFLLSNIIPQDLTANQKDWYHLESLSRDLAHYFDDVHCISGPLALSQQFEENRRNCTHVLHADGGGEIGGTGIPRDIVQYEVLGKSKICVPTHMFKVIFAARPKTPELEGKYGDKDRIYAAAFVVPNNSAAQNKMPQAYQVSLLHLEKLSGLVLLSWNDFMDRVHHGCTMQASVAPHNETEQDIESKRSTAVLARNSRSSVYLGPHSFVDLCKDNGCESRRWKQWHRHHSDLPQHDI